jgi:hypothetical protein
LRFTGKPPASSLINGNHRRFTMLDNFRDQANVSPFLDEEEEEENITAEEEKSRRIPQKRFLGMTPAQRFVIAVMLLMMMCILGAFFLLLTERIALPFP